MHMNRHPTVSSQLAVNDARVKSEAGSNTGIPTPSVVNDNIINAISAIHAGEYDYGCMCASVHRVIVYSAHIWVGLQSRIHCRSECP